LSVLEKIETIQDLQNLDEKKLPQLCQEIRSEIINTVSKTGGHLASNLGMVELTVALERIYNPFNDRIIFDVGHQCYTHKILTGRKDLSTLRQYKGISGFPKPKESYADAFIAGHASNSVSVALGMAKARGILKEDYNVVAIIGDGALTGGLSYEGLSNAALSKDPLVIILNDNNMSISKNVGGTARMLSALRVSPFYKGFKSTLKKMFEKNKGMFHFLFRTKNKIKKSLFQENIFSNMGFDYIGPVNGHNIKELERAISYAKGLNRPVLLHVLTKKGKGYKPAESSPSAFHGVGKFNVNSGEIYNTGKISYSSIFGDALVQQAKQHNDIVAITAAMCDGVGLEKFSFDYPDRFVDVGIAEGHAVSMAAGMAKQGVVPVFAVYASFLQRGYDMLIHDVSLQNLHTVFAIDHAGIVGNDGETHNGVYDVAFLSTIANMKILAPSSYAELEYMLDQAIHHMEGPVAVRYPKGCERNYSGCSKKEQEVLVKGKDATIVTYGDLLSNVLDAQEYLEKDGIRVEVIKLNQLWPLNSETIEESLKKTKNLLVVEDVASQGSIAEKLLAKLSGKFEFNHLEVNCNDGIIAQGSVEQIYKELSMDVEGIYYKTRELLKK